MVWKNPDLQAQTPACSIRSLKILSFAKTIAGAKVPALFFDEMFLKMNLHGGF